MHSLLAPILAQLVTVGLGDSVEARYVVNEDEHYFESSNGTTVGIGVTIDWRRASLSFGYSPSLSIAPLEESPRVFVLFHTAFVNGQYRWRRTTLSLSQSMGYGERDFRREALALRSTTPTPTGPQQPTPAPPNGGDPNSSGGLGGTGGTGGTGSGTSEAPAAIRAAPQTVRVVTLSTTASLDHTLSRSTTFRSYIGYTVAGGADEASKAVYPIVRGPNAGAGVGYQLDARNQFDTTLDGQLAWSAEGNNGFSLILNENWRYDFTRRTHSDMGPGVSYSRNEPPGGPTTHSIYPTGHAAIAHSTRLAGGSLALSLGVTASPVLDYTTASVDPRLAILARVGWTYRRLTLNADGGAAISLANDEAGAFNSVGASIGAGYDIGAGFSANSGVRGAWQTFEGATLIPPSAVTFVGLSWGAAVPLTHPRR